MRPIATHEPNQNPPQTRFIPRTYDASAMGEATKLQNFFMENEKI